MTAAQGRRTIPMRKRKTTSVELREFLRIAYCGLVLRGHDGERDIKDPILKEVWRLGKRINSDARRAALSPTGDEQV